MSQNSTDHPLTLAEIIVAKIMCDLSDRKGVGDELSDVDQEIKIEMYEELIEKVQKALNGDTLNSREQRHTLSVLTEEDEEDEEDEE